MTEPQHIGLSLGRIAHWHDGLGEFSRQLGLALAGQAQRLRDERGWQLHFHLPARLHGVFGDAVGYLATHTSQRWLHPRGTRFALWHVLHPDQRPTVWRRIGEEIDAEKVGRLDALGAGILPLRLLAPHDQWDSHLIGDAGWDRPDGAVLGVAHVPDAL